MIAFIWWVSLQYGAIILIIFNDWGNLKENHRETALLGADPEAFLPVADLTIRIQDDGDDDDHDKDDDDDEDVQPESLRRLPRTFPSDAAQAAARLLSTHLPIVVIIIIIIIISITTIVILLFFSS